jgi:hypothetical protein
MVAKQSNSSNTNFVPLPLTIHFVTLVMLLCGVMGGLWQHGHPSLVVGVLGAIPLLGMASRLPRRWLPLPVIWGGQIVLSLLAGAWLFYRLRSVAVDIALVEAISLLALALVLRLDQEHKMCSLISLLLVSYGGVVPIRSVYLPVTFLYLSCAILLLYQTRTTPLSGPQGGAATGSPWRYRLGHLLAVLAVWGWLVAIIPKPERGRSGIVPVSFATQRETSFPVLWQNWLRTKRKNSSPKGAETMEATNTVHLLSKTAKTLVKAPEAEDALDSRDGDGAGAGNMGKELVFRVRSPHKLYWLAQLYDLYDGNKWKISPPLGRVFKSWRHSRAPANTQMVRQQFQIEKQITPMLFGAYRATGFQWGKTPGEPAPATVWREAGLKLSGKLPALPWQYTLDSSVLVGDSPPEAPQKPHRDSLKTTCPGVTFSPRLRNLAKELTAMQPTSLDKALALQNFLRGHATYTLTPPSIPPDREAVDYFLFESRKGYCVHFAQSLTILARLAGLRARLATGYAPGKYNVLTGLFEVYEYHAHAWTQIWVDPYGWMSFDGVAPGAIDMDSLPGVLGKIWDPFGKEWSSRPPEMALKALDSGEAQAKSVGPAMNADKKAEIKKSMAKAIARDQVKRKLTSLLSPKNLWKRLRETVTAWRPVLKIRLRNFGRWVVDVAQTLTWTKTLASLVVCLALKILLKRQTELLKRLRLWHRHWRCRQLRQQLKTEPPSCPKAFTQLCRQLTMELLDLEGIVRPDNTDLLEFAGFVSRKKPALGASLDTIFRGFSLSHYSLQPLSAECMEDICGATLRVWELIPPGGPQQVKPTSLG